MDNNEKLIFKTGEGDLLACSELIKAGAFINVKGGMVSRHFITPRTFPISTQ